MQAPAPKIVHSVALTNTGSTPVRVIATYDHHDKGTQEVEATVAAGAVHTFSAVEVDMGSWVSSD
jgi:hypothetical protein